MWLEFVAYDEADNIIYQSGVIPDGEVVPKPAGTPGYDPDLWVLRDQIFDEDGKEAHMFWEAAASETHPEGYEMATLPETQQLGMSHTVTRTYRLVRQPARVRVQVHVQPIGREVLDSLVESKDLEASIAKAIPTLTLSGSAREWKLTDGFATCAETAQQPPVMCQSYACLLHPDLPTCK
jgi:hypothetical protein